MAQSNVIIIHGAYGFPDENWFGWLRTELEQWGVQCIVPAMPTPDRQDVQTWLQQFNAIAGEHIHTNTIMVGHSLGAAFVLRWLELTACRVRAAMLAGTFIGKVGVDKFDKINASFFSETFDWIRIKQHCRHFYCYQGNDDPYVSLDHIDSIATALSAKKIIISRGGHLNAAAGYLRFPLLLQYIKQLIIKDAKHD